MNSFLDVLRDLLRRYHSHKVFEPLHLVAVVCDQESDDLWALEYLLNHMVSQKDMPVYYASLDAENNNQTFESEMMRTFKQAAQHAGDHVTFHAWTGVLCNSKASQSQALQLSLHNQLEEQQQKIRQEEAKDKEEFYEWLGLPLPPEKATKSPVGLVLRQDGSNVGGLKRVVFVSARLTPTCIGKLNHVLQTLAPDHLILSGNLEKVQDWGGDNSEYRERMDLAVKTIMFGGTIIAVNVPTPDNVTARFIDYTKDSIIGAQPVAPTEFERSIIHTVSDVISTSQCKPPSVNSLHQRLHEIWNMPLPLATTVPEGDFLRHLADNLTTEERHGIWDSERPPNVNMLHIVRAARQSLEKMEGDKILFPDDTAHWTQLRSALRAYAYPFHSGDVSDLANAVVGLCKLQSLIAPKKRHIIHVTGSEASISDYPSRNRPTAFTNDGPPGGQGRSSARLTTRQLGGG